MLLTYTYVQGEEQIKKLLTKMGKCSNIRFMESFAHVDDITIERIEERKNMEGPYQPYFILMMPHEKGLYHASDIRHMVHEDIRNGAKKMRIV